MEQQTEKHHLSQAEIQRLFQKRPCRRCGQPTQFPVTKLCVTCWHLEKFINEAPEIAIEILCEQGYRVEKIL